MPRTLFYTTMINHRPVYTANKNKTERRNESAFHPTSLRDSIDANSNPNNVPTQILRNTLARSTQPIFSVSAMFGIRSGTGCGACGH